MENIRERLEELGYSTQEIENGQYMVCRPYNTMTPREFDEQVTILERRMQNTKMKIANNNTLIDMEKKMPYPDHHKIKALNNSTQQIQSQETLEIHRLLRQLDTVKIIKNMEQVQQEAARLGHQEIELRIKNLREKNQ